LTIKYLRRESFLFLPTLLSKIAITADQKAPLRTMSLEELSHPHDWPRRSLRDRRPNVLGHQRLQAFAAICRHRIAPLLVGA